MKDLGYGQGYRYAHDEAEGTAACLPESLRDRRYYAPGARGQEAEVAARLEAARLIRGRKTERPPRA